MGANLIHGLLTALLLSTTSIAQTDDAVSIGGVEWIEPIVSAPLNHDVAGFAYPPQEGEDSSGTPFVVSTTHGSPRIYRLKNEVLDSGGLVWSSRPNELYLSSGGIYLWRLGQAPRKLWDGVTAGLAISNDGRRLAFWNLETSDAEFDELVTFDIEASRELRRWKVRVGWNKDEHYFDLWFGKDSNVVYARTFEAEDTRPLRVFEIDTGKTNILTMNGVCLARTADGVFYVEATKPYYLSNDHFNLFMLKDRSSGELLNSNLLAAVCNGHATVHRLVGVARHRVWIYDTAHRTIKSFPTTCDRAAVFSDGSLVFAHKNRLFWGKCEPPRRRVRK